MIDGWLPWLPHRSNIELARRFAIAKISNSPASLRLRFGFPGLPDSAYLEVEFSRVHGQPTAWETYVEGKLIQRLRFADIENTPLGPRAKSVTLENGNGEAIGAGSWSRPMSMRRSPAWRTAGRDT